MMIGRPGVLLLFTTLVLPAFGSMQEKNLTMSGIVSDATSRNPIEGAKVMLVGDKAQSDTVTDVSGSFILTLRSGVPEGASVIIRVEKADYKTYQKLVAVSSTIPLQVPLTANNSRPPSSKPPRQHAEQPVTTEQKPKPLEPPPATTTQTQVQAAGAPPGIIPQDPLKAVETVTRMRRSLTEILEKKETITFLMSWPDNDNTTMVLVTHLLSEACRNPPRQCWFTQQGNPRNLDRPPVKASERRGITVHGPDAYALATALGDWFSTYSTSSFPPELNGYKEPGTKEIIWIEIGPGSPWKPTAP